MTYPAFCRNCNLDEVPEPGQLCEECQEHEDQLCAEFSQQTEHDAAPRPTDDTRPS